MRFAFGRTIRKSTAIITVSNYTARTLQRMFDTPPGRFDVIHHAAQSGFKPQDAATIKAMRQLSVCYLAHLFYLLAKDVHTKIMQALLLPLLHLKHAIRMIWLSLDRLILAILSRK